MSNEHNNNNNTTTTSTSNTVAAAATATPSIINTAGIQQFNDQQLKKKVEMVIDLLTTYLEQPFGLHSAAIDASTDVILDQVQPPITTTTTTTTTTSIPSSSTNNIKSDHHIGSGTDHIHININETSSHHRDDLSSVSSSTNEKYNIFFKPIYPGSNTTVHDVAAIASKLSQNEPINQLIIKKILSNGFAKSRKELLCQWFYNWYNLDSLTCKRYMLSFLPAMIWVYLYSNPSDVIGLEACLLTVYNSELLRREDRDTVFQPPAVQLPSYIYRSDEAARLNNNNGNGGGGLTEAALRQLSLGTGAGVVIDKALPRIESITTTNRNLLLRTVIGVYTSHLAYYPHISRVIFCEMATRIAATGYPFIPPQQDAPPSPDNEDGGRGGSFSSASNFRIDGSDGEGESSLKRGHGDGSSNLLKETIRRNSMIGNLDQVLDGSGGFNSSGNTVDTLERMWMEKEREKKMDHFSCMTTFLEFEYSELNNRIIDLAQGGTTSEQQQEFHHQHHHILSLHTLLTTQRQKRIFIDPRTYQEIVSGLGYCAFQESTKSMASIAIKAINDRASYDLIPEIMLSTNSILHVIQINKSSGGK
ncbi:hypothetical protein DFA_08062 [Cavenderia fasciculata]|uniref:Uncharacterized protein n=1 Tax=Cavenderia fasciculata TaxID=261658 RepID=F4Q4X4_CACFS|nr:uncharacterized protein DFA_08062 [Cavenderia fasciculata]EGG17080.1 hypothetical protein DFA_08062 [Cavenderia fasciculata]|eukprot:XP_004355564.1 hypothetical protein DFA_08062 [Cavenderia fasciculata]